MKELFEQLQIAANELFKNKQTAIKKWLLDIESPPYSGWALRRAEPVLSGKELRVFYECFRHDPMFDDFVTSCLIPIEYLDSEDPEQYIKDLKFKEKEDERNRERDLLHQELMNIEAKIKNLQKDKEALQKRISKT